ncbi:MAG: glycoside hydrolase family 25 [Lachnospiraceae bacterium]|nr:glycoside hydrolase family 25 [Lachnospiraceae bacterium]
MDNEGRDNKFIIPIILVGIPILLIAALIAKMLLFTGAEEEAETIVVEQIEVQPGEENAETEGENEDSSLQESATETMTAEDADPDEPTTGDGAADSNTDSQASDPEGQVTKETGAAVDVTKLVSAGSAGENNSVTYGIDVSRFQGTIDWTQVAGSGVQFAMVRVGYRDAVTGEIKADTNAKYNMQEAEKVGIKIGAYFFSTAITQDEAVEEANWVTEQIAKYPITYPVGYNCEGFENPSSRQVNLSKDERSNIAKAFLNQIYSAGYTPIFYASRGELQGDAKWNTSQIQQTYKIWMAWYNQNTDSIATGPAYDGQCAMWQYTNQGTVPGISRPVDVDVAYFGYDGTEQAKDTSERETASADVEALMHFDPADENVTAKNTTNLRNKPSHGEDSTVMVTLTNGQVAHRTGTSPSGWSRVEYEGGVYYAVSSYLTTDLSAPAQQTTQPETDTSGFKTKFTDCNEIVTAKDVVNLRSKPSVTDADSVVVVQLKAGENVTRTGINNEYGWSRVDYNGQILYCVSSYLRVVE